MVVEGGATFIPDDVDRQTLSPRPQLPTNFQPAPSLENSLSPPTTSNQLPTCAEFDKLLDPAHNFQPTSNLRQVRELSATLSSGGGR